MTLIDFRPSTPASTTTAPTTTISRAPRGSRHLATATATAPAKPQPVKAGPRAVPTGTEARGFVLYVGLDEVTAEASGTDLSQIVQALKQFTATLSPAAQTHAAVALAPAGAGGRSIDVVRLALQEPVAVAAHRAEAATASSAESALVIDFARKTVSLDGQAITLTYTELALLEYLIHHEGRAVARTELLNELWGTPTRQNGTESAESAAHAPNERTIDVHVRRLRAKLGQFEQIVRTVRGAGYRFDQHPDVSVHFDHTRQARTA